MKNKKSLILKILIYCILGLFLLLSFLGKIDFDNIERNLGLAVIIAVVIMFFNRHGVSGGIKYFFKSFFQALFYSIIICLGTALLVFVGYKITVIIGKILGVI